MSHNRFSRIFVLTVLAFAILLPASAFARTRIGIGLGYYGGYGYGGPWGYGPYGYPYAYGYSPYGYYPGRPLGEVHIKSPDSEARIYINGAFAGRAHDLKTIYLAPGTYNIEQRIGPDVQRERVYVLANRTLKLEFEKPGMGHPPAPLNTAPPAPPANAPQPPAPAPEAQR